MLLDHFFKEHVEYDFFRMFCGERLGGGQGREVWSFGLDDKYVIKFEGGDHSFQNVLEWNLWNDAKEMGNPDVLKWLAPCDRISANGQILIMERTKPAKKYPDQIPAFFTDTKRNNFGMIGNRFVCHDYGTHRMCNGGLTKRLFKPKWYDEP